MCLSFLLTDTIPVSVPSRGNRVIDHPDTPYILDVKITVSVPSRGNRVIDTLESIVKLSTALGFRPLSGK